ncbi:MAG TPA: ribonuclease domain-containing protein, partial [Puia sp.]|nr:ribonuclease domain-containing protein [Puia sp.]
HRSRSTINAVTVDIRPLTRNRNYVLGGNQPFLVNYSPAKKGANLTIAKQTVKLSGIVISIVPVGRGVKALYSLYRLNQLFEEAKIPETAGNVADNALNKNGATLRGWKGGSLYANDGRSGGEILPEEDADGNPITYKEYDVWPKVPGQNRGGERVIVGSDNSAYYINNHYQSFTQIRGN